MLAKWNYAFHWTKWWAVDSNAMLASFRLFDCPFRIYQFFATERIDRMRSDSLPPCSIHQYTRGISDVCVKHSSRPCLILMFGITSFLPTYMQWHLMSPVALQGCCPGSGILSYESISWLTVFFSLRCRWDRTAREEKAERSTTDVKRDNKIV